MRSNDPADSLLLRIADRLEAQAQESRRGGWSTHQCEEQQELAIKIRNAVVTEKYDEVLLRAEVRDGR